MTPTTYVGIDPAALDGIQALDSAWTLDGSVPGVMTYATTTGAAMTKASAAAATMTGA